MPGACAKFLTNGGALKKEQISFSPRALTVRFHSNTMIFWFPGHVLLNYLTLESQQPT